MEATPAASHTPLGPPAPRAWLVAARRDVSVGDSLLGLGNLGSSSLEHLFEICIPAWCSEMETAVPRYR